VQGEAEPKSEYSHSWRHICRKVLVIREDKKIGIEILPIALPKYEMDLVF
jgi:hypothetical protein